MKTPASIEPVSKILAEIAAPMRLAILLSLGETEACVCHLEAVLKKRQAHISQHLMALRQAGLIAARREGRFVYYRLAKPAVLDLIRTAAGLAGADVSRMITPKGCGCPKCDPPGEQPAAILSIGQR